MKFHDYQTHYSFYKKMGFFNAHMMPWQEWYINTLKNAVASNDRVSTSLLKMEYNWCSDLQPYYNIWPAVIPTLLRLNLALSTSYLKPPKQDLLIRLPVEKNPIYFEWNNKRYDIRTILMTEIAIVQKGCPGVGMWIDFGEEIEGHPILSYRNISCDGKNSLEDEVEMLPMHWGETVGIQMPIETTKNCIRLCCTLCLLENDPEVITADVLNKDKVKFENTGDEKFIEKARRRGKVGWDIGKKITVSPHYRIPHSCLFWTGEGHAIPIIKIRAGTIVHRKIVETIPTGHLMLEEKNKNL